MQNNRTIFNRLNYSVFIIVLNILLFWNFSVNAQSSFFSNLKIDKTLQQFETFDIFQDSKGYIWFATNHGLYRHDGFENIKYGLSDSLFPSPVTCIGEDSNKVLWVGHKNGIIEMFDGAYFNDFKPEEGLSSSEITFIYFDQSKVMWFGTLGEGIYYYTGKNRKRLYNLNSEDGLNDNYAYTMVQCPLGDLYVGTDMGIAVIDTLSKKVERVISMKNGLPDNIVKHLIIKNTTLWIGMEEGGFSTYDIKDQKFKLNIPWEFGTVNNFAMRSPTECWVSTKTNGLIRFDINSDQTIIFKQFTTRHNLKSNRTFCVFSDRERNIWAGEASSIVKSAASPFEFLDSREGFNYDNLFAFINDSKGRYWAATEKGLLRITKDAIGNTVTKTFIPMQKEAQTAFVCLFEDYQGYIWAGTYGYGAFRIDPKNLTYRYYSIQNGLPDNNIMQITGSGSKIWFATLGGGASCFDSEEEKFQNISKKDGISSNYVYSVFIDSKNKAWFAQDGGGISSFDNNKITTGIIPDSLKIKTVYSFAEDKNGHLWISTAEHGIVHYSDDRFTIINESDGYKIMTLRSIISDNFGNILLAGNDAFQEYSPGPDGFKTYAEESGVSFLEPNLNAISKDFEGNIWISTRKGVVKYNPSFNEVDKVVPKVIISKKLLFFEPITNNQSRFNFKQKHLSFEYSGFWYQSPENLIYRYKLQNYDFDWNRPTRARSVTYSNLPPGEYTFIVEVSHKPGFWTGSPEAVFTFSIKPPFYKTWWFISMVTILIVSLTYFFVKARIAKLEKDKERLENEVRKRTTTIVQQKEEIEAQRDFVTKQRDQIAFQNANITSSIQYASRIQQAIFPPDEAMSNLLGEHFILNRPMEIVSGDFYWINSKDDQVVLAVADCTGHGVPGAFMSVLGISLLNKIAIGVQCCQPDEILNRLREEVKEALRQTGKQYEAKDGMDISVITFNRENMLMEYAGANNPVYVIRNKEFISLPCDRMPIGIYIKENPFSLNEFQLQTNDMVYLFSDGYHDQLGGNKDSKFMKRRFQELLLSISHLPVNEQHNLLNQNMNEWKAGRHQNDDILVIGIRF